MSTTQTLDRVKQFLRKTKPEDLAALAKYLEPKIGELISTKLDTAFDHFYEYYDERVGEHDEKLAEEQDYNDERIDKLRSRYAAELDELREMREVDFDATKSQFDKDLKECHEKSRKTLKAVGNDHIREIERLEAAYLREQTTITEKYAELEDRAREACDDAIKQQRTVMRRFKDDHIYYKRDDFNSVIKNARSIHKETTKSMTSALYELMLQPLETKTRSARFLGPRQYLEKQDQMLSEASAGGWNDMRCSITDEDTDSSSSSSDTSTIRKPSRQLPKIYTPEFSDIVKSVKSDSTSITADSQSETPRVESAWGSWADPAQTRRDGGSSDVILQDNGNDWAKAVNSRDEDLPRKTINKGRSPRVKLPHKCDYKGCTKECKTPADLEQHRAHKKHYPNKERSHLMKEFHQCCYAGCGKGFQTLVDLGQHITDKHLGNTAW